MSPTEYRCLLIRLDITDEEADRLLMLEPGTSAGYGSSGSEGPPEHVVSFLMEIATEGVGGDAIREALRREA